MSRLFVFRGLAHDPQRILATVYRLAFVGVELCLKISTLELSITPFADGEGRRGWFYDSKFALHGFSLAHSAGRQ